MSTVILYYCQDIYGINWSCASWVSFICVWDALFGVVTIGIFCWDKSLAALVLPYRHPTLHFVTGWVVSALIKVGIFGLFYCAIIQPLLLALLISFSLYVFLCSVAVIWYNWACLSLIDFRYI